jgi:hypothetical protein
MLSATYQPMMTGKQSICPPLLNPWRIFALRKIPILIVRAGLHISLASADPMAENANNKKGKSTMKIKFIAKAVRWFDRHNGNTYHSVMVTRCRDGKTLAVPFTYGYGDSYRQSALEAMASAKWLPVKYRGRHDNGSHHAFCYERENKYPIQWNVADGLKRDCIANGII